MHIGVERDERTVEVRAQCLAAGRIAQLVMAGTYLGQPLPARARQERADRMQLDHAAKLVIFPDEGDLRINDLNPGSRFHFDEAKFFEKHEGLAERRQRYPENGAQIVLRNHHTRRQAPLLHRLAEAPVSVGVTVLTQEQPQDAKTGARDRESRPPGRHISTTGVATRPTVAGRKVSA